jgi:hypothetical protein
MPHSLDSAPSATAGNGRPEVMLEVPTPKSNAAQHGDETKKKSIAMNLTIKP